jgi:hypothetical protein
MHHENLKSINMKNKTSAKILPLPAHDDAVEMVKPGNAPVRRMSSLVLDMLIKWSGKEEGPSEIPLFTFRLLLARLTRADRDEKWVR